MSDYIKFKDRYSYKLTQSCDWIVDPKFWNDYTNLKNKEFERILNATKRICDALFK